MTTESESTVTSTQYEFEPFELVFLRRRDQILQMTNLTHFALRSLDGAARLSKVLGKDDEEVNSMAAIENAARDEIKADMPLIHGAATVLIWGALESSFRDFLVRWLVTHPKARQAEALRGVRIKLTEYESHDGEDRMRYLLGVLERELGSGLRPGIGRFESLLQPFGIVVSTNETARRNLSELAAVRNVIVHRAGIADGRLLELCPWLNLSVGQEVAVGHDSFIRYVDAASNFAANVIEGAQSALSVQGAIN